MVVVIRRIYFLFLMGPSEHRKSLNRFLIKYLYRVTRTWSQSTNIIYSQIGSAKCWQVWVFKASVGGIYRSIYDDCKAKMPARTHMWTSHSTEPHEHSFNAEELLGKIGKYSQIQSTGYSNYKNSDIIDAFLVAQ